MSNKFPHISIIVIGLNEENHLVETFEAIKNTKKHKIRKRYLPEKFKSQY
ncbi:MAG: hypothetical protein ACOCRX_07700 [Candidatus Woesearchaeota archaeon]